MRNQTREARSPRAPKPPVEPAIPKQVPGVSSRFKWKSAKDHPEVKLDEIWSGLATDGNSVFAAKFGIKHHNAFTGERSYQWTSPKFRGDITKKVTEWRVKPPLPPEKS